MKDAQTHGPESTADTAPQRPCARAVILDEALELLEELAEDLARKAKASGIGEIFTTSNPVNEVISR